MSDPDASTLPASDPQVSTTEPLPSRASLSGTEKKDPETYDFVLRLRCAQQGWGRGGGVCVTLSSGWEEGVSGGCFLEEIKMELHFGGSQLNRLGTFHGHEAKQGGKK